MGFFDFDMNATKPDNIPTLSATTASSSSSIPVEPQVPMSPEELVASVSADLISKALKYAEETEELKLDVHSLAPWSVSKIKCLDKCPLQFFFKYIMKYKVPAAIRAEDDLSTTAGKALHSVLEYAIAGMTVAKSFARAKPQYVPSQMTDEEWAAEVESLSGNIYAFNERIMAITSQYPVKRVFTEIQLAVNKEWEPTGFFSDDCFFRGVVDAIVQLTNGDILIFDHKRNATPHFKPYEFQTSTYKVLFNYGIEKITGAQAYIHNISAGEVVAGRYTDADHIETFQKEFIKVSIEGVVDQLIDTGKFKQSRGNQCKWCEFDQLGCKDKKFKQITEHTIKLFK